VKRRALEEVKDTDDTLTASRGSVGVRARREAPTSTIDNSMFSTPDLAAWYFQDFLRSGSGKKFSGFLLPMLAVASPGPLLSSSLLALSMGLFGKVKQDFTAYQKGQTFYVSSLRQLQTALNDPVKRMTEETLAVTAVLGVFEVSTLNRARHTC
jgi:hypothetical protein